MTALNKTKVCAGHDHTFPVTQQTIDYILIQDTFVDCVSSCTVFSTEDTEIASDHHPITAQFRQEVARYNTFKQKQPNPTWTKATINSLIAYQLLVDSEINSLPDLSRIDDSTHIEMLCEQLTFILNNAAKQCIPHSEYNPVLKPYWTKDVRTSHKIARTKRKIWIEAGRPRGNQYDAYREYKAAKRHFRELHEKAYTDYETNMNEELNVAADCDIRLFWQLIRRRKKQPPNICNEIKMNNAIARDPESIANQFANFFEKLYHSPDSDTRTPTEIFTEVSMDESCEELNREISFDEIVEAIQKMYKLYESIIHKWLTSWLAENCSTFPNEQQQGFQRFIGCQTASFLLQETLYANIEQHSKMYAAFLDIKNAFDTVWHSGLLYKLKQKGIKGKLLTIIRNTYSGLKSTILCNGTTSRWVDMERGLRQGGVLSTLYYLIFIDDLLNELSDSNYGAPLNAIRCGNLTLADDITLLALSPRALQNLLDICQNYSFQWKFKFNATKSCTVVFGGRSDSNMFHWILDGIELEVKETHEHLGIPISNNLSCSKKIEKSYNTSDEGFVQIIFGQEQESNEDSKTFQIMATRFLRAASHAFLAPNDQN
ncbi:uncharacterized protein LOC117331249 [Pecten maximus]|uniref:uncharacterized protein LOC117331249 n=1 Tax=Pecten maximus TaxID=6579 RepID=UPI001458FF94|nr:uncharacterized protein LOC117331249 [Pecten maximus]